MQVRKMLFFKESWDSHAVSWSQFGGHQESHQILTGSWGLAELFQFLESKVTLTEQLDYYKQHQVLYEPQRLQFEDLL